MAWAFWRRNKQSEGPIPQPAADAHHQTGETDDAMIDRRTDEILHLLNFRDDKFPTTNFYDQLRGQVINVRPYLMESGVGTHDDAVHCFVREWVRAWVSQFSEQRYSEIISQEFPADIYYSITCNSELTRKSLQRPEFVEILSKTRDAIGRQSRT